ncbi:MAG: ABC transporter transmembrane domain-containing protein [Marivibrio sp.]|uniref:ABC transporter transmembrane domain-containing protein n=1 Tax=Marivibrio sp. TaxID=2039719 RepID=UPI0032ECAB8F
MDHSMFRFIWRNSRLQQVLTLLLTAASLPFLYYSFDLPKTIINDAINGDGTPVDLLGVQLTQIQYLFVLCGVFLALVIVNGAFKMKINTYKGVMAERLLRRLRYILLARTLRFPLPQFQKTSSGEIVTMVTAEVEPLGGFFGDAFALVAFQGGTFLTIMVFMFVQDPLLGLAAFALIPVQGYIIPKMQRKVNALGKERVKHVRALSNRVGEVAGGVPEVRAQDHAGHVMADVSRRLGKIFDIRFEIYQRKFFMKFVNNFINQMTPFLFYAIGGYLVIQGELSFGALVAALAAYKDLAAPWKELLNYYQRLADARIKYEQLISQFEPDGMLDERLQQGRPEEEPRLDGPIETANLTWADEDGVRVIDGASVTIPGGRVTGVLSSSGLAKEVLARLLARLLTPTSGRVKIGETDLARLHEGVTGARIGYVGVEPAFFNGTIAANMFFGLQRRPPDPKQEEDADAERRREIEEAEASGNSPFDPAKDWTDYALAGVADRAELTERAIDLLGAVEMEADMYDIGLRQSVDPEAEPDLAGKVMEARGRLREALDAHGFDDLVQTYDMDRYNTYSSVGGNILFGRPTTDEWAFDRLHENPKLRRLMDKRGLTERFTEIGLKCAELMVELFKDLPPNHPFFEQYSFVDEELLPELKLIARKAKSGGDLTAEERAVLAGLPFKLVIQRHRLGLIDEAMQAELVALRKELHETYPEDFKPAGAVEPFDPARFNRGLSILDNMLFGRIVHGRSDATERVQAVVTEVCEALELRRAIVRVAFDFPVGVNGARLATVQRQKLSLVRNALKRPDVLVLCDALNAVDPESQARILPALRAETPEATWIWIAGAPPPGLSPDHVFDIRNGRLVEAGERPEQEDEPQATAPAEGSLDGADEALGAEAQTLRQVPLFANLDPTRLKFLAFTSERKIYQPGEVLMREGEDGDAAYVILDGLADVLVGDGPTEKVLFPLGPNKLVGELALLNDAKRSATVRAVEKTTALRLSREVFSEMARQDPYFAFEMTRDLGRRLILTTDQLNDAREEIATLRG